MKTTEEIYQALLAAFAQRAGFTPEADCDLAVRLYAAAAELQALDIQGEWVLDQSFPQTAQGVYLDYHAQMRGITRTAATKAVGTLRFSVEQAARLLDQPFPSTPTGLRDHAILEVLYGCGLRVDYKYAYIVEE